jgi:SAM-dependent methyltransferase
MGGPVPDVRSGQYSRRGNLRKYESRNPVQRLLIWHFHRRVGELVEAAHPRSILDVGCGEGFTIDYLLRANGQLHLRGVDFDWSALRRAKGKHPGVLFEMADIGRLPYASAGFDLVLCLEVLEHLPEPLPALEELRRVSGQRCVISVPNEPYFMLANFLRGKNVRAWGNDPEHLQRWTAGQFRELVERYFEVERVLYPFPWVLAECRA